MARPVKKLPVAAQPTLNLEVIAGGGAPFDDQEAKKIAKWIETLSLKKGGALTYTDIWDNSHNNPSSPFYRHLEKDAKVALKRYHLVQIARIVAYVKYKVELGATKVEPRVFTKVRVDTTNTPSASPGPSIVHTSTVVTTTDYREQVLERALGELRRWQATYQTFNDYASLFQPIFVAIDAFEKKMKKKK